MKSTPSGLLLTTQQTIPGSHKVAIVLTYVVVFIIALPLFLFAMGQRLDVLMPVPLPESDLTVVLGLTAISVGLGVLIGAMVQLWFQGRGYPISHLPPTQFVSTGLYRLMRHPIYVGFALTFAGAALSYQSAWSLFFSVPLLTIGWICYVRFCEEPALIARFGDIYLEYRARTHLFLPPNLPVWLVNASRLVAAAASSVLSRISSHTILYRRGGAIFVTYGALVAVGSLLMMQHLAALMLAQGFPAGYIRGYLAGGALLGMFGGRLFWWIGSWRALIGQPFLGIRHVGFVSWGAFAGMLLASAVLALVSERSVLIVTDLVAFSGFTAYAIGRIGCLTYGCCYGLPSDTYGVRYTNPNAKVFRERGFEHPLRHPTQAYSAFHGLVLVVSLNLILQGGPPVGLATAMAFLLYAAGRMPIEWLRDRQRYVRGHFTTGHLGCLVMFAAGSLLLFLIDGSVARVVRPLTLVDLFASLSLAPVTLVAACIVFLVLGFHWKRIGRW